MNKRSALKNIAIGALIGLADIVAGCGPIPDGAMYALQDSAPEQRAQETTRQSAQKKIYQSPIVKPEYDFVELGLVGGDSIKEEDYPAVKGGDVYVVGYSLVFSTIKDACDRTSWRTSWNRLGIAAKVAELSNAELYDKETQIEIHELQKNGKRGYAAHALWKIPLSNFNKKTQEMLKTRYSK